MAPRLSLAVVFSFLAAVPGQEISPRESAHVPELTPAVVSPPKVDAMGDPLPAGARARLGTLRFRPGGPLAAAVLSPDGKWIVSAAGSDILTLSDPKSGKEITRLRVPGGYGATFLTFAPDSQNLAVLGFAPLLHVVAIPSGKVVSKIQVPQPSSSRLCNVAFSGDGKLIAAGTDNFGQNKNFVHVWESATGKPVQSFEVVQNSQIRAALSHDGAILATTGYYSPRNGGENNADQGRTIQLWDTRSGKELRKLVVERNSVIAVAVSPDGRTIAAASGAATFHLFQTESGKELHRFAGRRGHTQLLQFAPDGKTLLACTADGVIQRWDAASGSRLGAAEGPRLFSLAFPSPGQIWALGMEGQALTLWDALDDKPLATSAGHTTGISLVAFTNKGKTLVTGSADGKLYSWDSATGNEERQRTIRDEESFRGYVPGGRVGGFALSRDGRFLATASDYGNGTIRVHDLVTGKTVCDLDVPRTGAAAGFAFSPDNTRLAALSAHGVYLWDIVSGHELPVLTWKQDSATSQNVTDGSLIFSPDGKLIAATRVRYDTAAGITAGEVHLWNVETRSEIIKLEGVGHQNGLAFAPGGQLLALATPGQGIVLVKTATGKEVARLRTESSAPIEAVAFSPDGRLVAGSQQQRGFATLRYAATTPALDYHIVVWELATGQPRHAFSGHRGPIACLAFAPDGRTLASASADTTALLWDLSGKQRLGLSISQEAAEKAWTGLADANAERASGHMSTLISAPEMALTVLRDRLAPAAAAKANAAEITRLIADLDSDKFAERVKASAALTEFGPIAAQALQQALGKPASLEAERRIKALLERLDRPTLTEELTQQMRAVEVLERIEAAQASALLHELAKGAPQHRLTIEAAGALRRLEGK